MTVKFLKDLNSTFGNYFKNTIHELEHEAHVIENWIETGYCELVKEVRKRPVKQDENQSSSD